MVSLATLGDALSVDVASGFAYVYDDESTTPDPPKFRVIDVSSPGAPSEAGSFAYFPPDTIYARDIEVVGDLAFMAAYNSLRVMNVSNPAAPAELGAIYVASALRISVVGNLAFVAAGASGFHVIDFGPEYTALPEPPGSTLLAAGVAALAWLRSARRRSIDARFYRRSQIDGARDSVSRQASLDRLGLSSHPLSSSPCGNSNRASAAGGRAVV
jgi:hypothetical protein